MFGLHNLKIKWKIIFPYGFLIFLMMGSMLAWYITTVAHYMEDQQLKKMDIVIQEMAEAVSFPLSILDYDGLQRSLKHLQKIDEDIQYIVLQGNNDQTISIVGTAFPEQKTIPVENNLRTMSLASGVRLIEVAENGPGFELQYPVKLFDVVLGELYIGMSSVKVFEIITKFVYINVFVGLGAIIIGIIIFVSIVQSEVTGPIKELNNISHKISSGNFEDRIAYSSQDEIGELAESFNNMASQLQQLMGTLSQQNVRLEAQIIERRQVQEEKCQLELRLIQSQKMESIGILAGGIAHDFNNILTAIFGFSQLALNNLQEPATLRRHLNEIIKGADRAKNLVMQILTFSRKSEPEKQPLQLTLVVEEALKLLRASIPTTIEMQQHLETEAIVLADPTQIHQIVLNLCTNAYHSMRDQGGFIEVCLEAVDVDQKTAARVHDLLPGKYVQLSVSDSGHGMDEITITRIFEPYFTTKRQGEGTGLGLSTVHGIVKNHKGAIAVKSEIGLGTTFSIFLPIENKEIIPTNTLSDRYTVPKLNGRILIVDDIEVNVYLVKVILQNAGCQVTGMTNSLEALELFRKNPDRFDLVITDQTMPDLTGYELTKQLLEIRPDIPIIMITGHSDIVDEHKAKQAGAYDFLMKPLDTARLVGSVRKALSLGLGTGRDLCTEADLSSQLVQKKGVANIPFEQRHGNT